MGGNLSAYNRNGNYYDVYPHMFCEWFHNFWKLAEDLGLYRERNFEKRSESGFLRPDDFPHYRVCADVGAFRTGVKNLLSGVLTLPELFIGEYTVLDLLARGDMEMDFLENQTLNDFVVNRPYATPAVTRFFDEAVNNIWSINSYLSSARAYQRFAKYQFREPSPQCWVLKGDSYQTLIKPLCKKLEELGCSFQKLTEVTGVSVRDGRVAEISYSKKDDNDKEIAAGTVPIDNLIIAATPASLGELIFAKALDKSGAKSDAKSIVSQLPQLANVRRLGSDPLPVLYVTFRRPPPHIPPYYVALMDSKYSLTFVKVKELSERQGKTVIAIAASDFDALPVKFAIKRVREALGRVQFSVVDWMSRDDELIDAALPILNEFRRYVPINVGTGWGDSNSDVEWNDTFFQPNLDQQLFVNQVGSQHMCTKVHYPEIQNLYFAGNACANPITIATVESGVYSGLQAAQAVVEQHRGAAKPKPVPIIEPEVYPTPLLFAWKIMLAPYAALAKLWIEADTLGKDVMGAGSRPSGLAGAHAGSELRQSAIAAVNAGWKLATPFGAKSCVSNPLTGRNASRHRMARRSVEFVL